MTATTQRLRFHGTGGALFGLMLVNALLTAITFGIYSFWARSKVRAYLYSETELAGDRFGYHGTGGELLRGWLKAMLVMIALVMAVVLAVIATTPTPVPGQRVQPSPAAVFIQFAYLIALSVLVTIAINGARRYRLSRSSWRGIRFSYSGRWQEFLAMNVRGTLLSAVTLGFYSPYFSNQSREFLVRHASFGSLPFDYDADGKDLFVSYLKTLLLAIPTLGLSFVWYKAFQHRYFWSHTTLGPARLSSNVTGGALLGLAVTNLLLVICTLGIGTPWAMTRMTRFSCDCLTLHGDVDWKTVQQQAQLPSATGEGLAQGLDVDVDLGLGM